jgi:hypothetical protein
MGMESEIQLVFFHPKYQFRDGQVSPVDHFDSLPLAVTLALPPLLLESDFHYQAISDLSIYVLSHLIYPNLICTILLRQELALKWALQISQEDLHGL